MRYLLRLSLVFAVIVGVLAGVAFLLPRRYSVERTVTIAAPPQAVFARVGDLRRWPEWNVWFRRDPKIQLEFPAGAAGAGAAVAWRSRVQGGGRIEVVRMTADEALEYRLVLNDMPVVSTGLIRCVATAGGGQTAVTWRTEGDLGWSPLTRWFGLLLGPLFGADLEEGLAAMKEAVEKNSPDVSRD